MFIVKPARGTWKPGRRSPSWNSFEAPFCHAVHETAASNMFCSRVDLALKRIHFYAPFPIILVNN
jgi:hypothetical protein